MIDPVLIDDFETWGEAGYVVWRVAPEDAPLALCIVWPAGELAGMLRPLHEAVRRTEGDYWRMLTTIGPKGIRDIAAQTDVSDLVADVEGAGTNPVLATGHGLVLLGVPESMCGTTTVVALSPVQLNRLGPTIVECTGVALAHEPVESYQAVLKSAYERPWPPEGVVDPSVEVARHDLRQQLQEFLKRSGHEAEPNQ